MEFSDWVHQRNFQAASDSLQATQVNSEMKFADIPMVLGLPEHASENGGFDTKNTKIKKQKPSTKRSNQIASKVLRPKQSKQKASVSTKKKGGAAKHEKNNTDVVIHGTAFDFSHVPTPVCSCTGVPHQCYRWGVGGWQSSCCTKNISEYPLPMSPSRPGARMAGRKMSNGAYGKLLERLATEGHDLSNAVDLKTHWAKHGTNKFVTIR
ncbi:protein BASIC PENTACYSTEINE7-like isoform X2 [Tasmannia lanceolata]